MAESRIDSILRRVDSMPPLPATAMKVIEIANDARSNVNDMDKVISMDPVFSAKLLRMVNSAYFGLPAKITKTSRAIAHLGMNTVKNLVLCAEVMKNLSDGLRTTSFDMEGFWKHSMGCSIATKFIARRINIPLHEIEDFAIAGLMHDIGKLVFINFIPKEYKAVVTYAVENKISFLAAERQQLDPDTVISVQVDEEDVDSAMVGYMEKRMDHSYVGGHLATKWDFPAIMYDVIAYHHFPWQCNNPFTQQAVHAVFVADIFAKSNNLGFSGDNFVPMIKRETWDILGITNEDLLRYKKQWLNEVEGAKEFLDV